MVQVISKEEWLQNKNLAIQERDERKTILTANIVSAHIDFNNMCQNMCLHCSHADKHHNNYLTIDQLNKLLEITKYACSIEMGCTAEPLMTKDLVLEYINKFRQINPYSYFQLGTNGINLDEEVQQNLIKNKSHLFVSLHSDNDDDYLKLTGSNEFARVVDNLISLKNKKRKANSEYPKVHFASLLSKLSDPFKIIEIANDCGVYDVGFLKFCCNRYSDRHLFFKKYSYAHIYSAEELINMITKLIEKGEEKNIVVRFPHFHKIKEKMPIHRNRFRTVGFGPGNLVEYSETYYDPKIPIEVTNDICRADTPWFKGFFCVDKFSHCTFSSPYIEWPNVSFEKIWNGKHMIEIRQKIINNETPSECSCNSVDNYIGPS